MQRIASEALERLPLKSSPTANAGTRSKCLAIPLKRGRVGTEDFLYIDVIARLPQRPKQPDDGFVEEDVIRLIQVCGFPLRPSLRGSEMQLEPIIGTDREPAENTDKPQSFAWTKSRRDLYEMHTLT